MSRKNKEYGRRIRLTPEEEALILNHRRTSNVGIIGDTHEPFCHPEYRNFCYEVFNRFGCTETSAITQLCLIMSLN